MKANSQNGASEGRAQAGAGRKSAAQAKPKVQQALTPPPPQRPVILPVVESPPAKPRQADNSIVAVGLAPDRLAQLTAQGFRTELQTKGTIANVVRLAPPPGMSLVQAQRAVQMADATATTDLDSYYYTDEGPTCTAPGCEAVAMVRWSAPTVEQCGPAPLIGVIDTGINLDHDALRGQSIEVLPTPQAHGSPSQQEHGTAVAALLVGRSGSSTPGLLPRAKVVAVDAFYRDGGTADRTDVTSLVMALEALAERNVRVVNMSLSGPPNEVLKSAVAAAQAKGMIIVAAAGNNGAGAEPSYPAAYPGVIAVTAVDRNLGVYSRATHGDYVDLAAPGVDLWVAAPNGGGTTKSGTSYAVPFISAAAAILRAYYETLDGPSLQATLEKATLDLGKPGRDSTYGYGLIQTANLCPASQEEKPVAQSGSALGAAIP